MGTRGLILFIRQGKRMGIYNQLDSYTEGLGIWFLKFLKTLLENGLLNDFIERLFKIEPTETYYNIDAKKVLEEIFDGKVSQYCNAEKFQDDDLFCEWCYIVDIDNNSIIVESGGSEYKNMKMTIENIDKTIEFFKIQ